jgi:hypothetical protein
MSMHGIYKKTYCRFLLVLAGILTAAVLTAADIPGPWHGDNDWGKQECQCPICKLAGKGLMDSRAVIQPTPPEPHPFLNPVERLSSEERSFVEVSSARAPPA